MPRVRPSIDRDAAVTAVPLLLPAIPFGFVLGLAITESEMPVWAATISSPLVFAGASQLAIVTLAGSASIWAIVTAVLVINSRHVMYSAALAPMFRPQPRWFRWIGPALLVDQVFALAVLQGERTPADFRRYYLTVGLVFFCFWNLTVPLGMLVGPIVPEAWRLDVAPAIMFAGLALLSINRVPAAIAASVGGTVSLVSAGLSDRLGIVVGAVCGVVAGSVADEVLARRAPGDAVEVVER